METLWAKGGKDLRAQLVELFHKARAKRGRVDGLTTAELLERSLLDDRSRQGGAFALLDQSVALSLELQGDLVAVDRETKCSESSESDDGGSPGLATDDEIVTHSPFSSPGPPVPVVQLDGQELSTRPFKQTTLQKFSSYKLKKNLREFFG